MNVVKVTGDKGQSSRRFIAGSRLLLKANPQANHSSLVKTFFILYSLHLPSSRTVARATVKRHANKTGIQSS